MQKDDLPANNDAVNASDGHGRSSSSPRNHNHIVTTSSSPPPPPSISPPLPTTLHWASFRFQPETKLVLKTKEELWRSEV